MKITYILLRGFKRLNLANIKEIEITFPNTITIIRGISGVGKSSILQELSPLPPVRTMYEKNGYKELHIEHNGHLFNLISDFSNRTSPHSFFMDDIELNDGHTTDIQEELVIKYFGFTPTIRNLIYYKVKICSMTKSERKNLFIDINPIDLELTLNLFKLSQSKFKDCKAQLQLLYSRKTELENKLIPDDILNQHIVTKDKLNQESLNLDKDIFQITQHVKSLTEEYQNDLKYYNECISQNKQIVPTEAIDRECNRIQFKLPKFVNIPRQDEFDIAFRNLNNEKNTCELEISHMKQSIDNLRNEINDYHTHLDRTEERPVVALENEIKQLEEEMGKYKNLSNNPVPPNKWNEYYQLLEEVKGLLFVFRDAEVKMIEPELLKQKIIRSQELQREINYTSVNLNGLIITIQDLNKDLNECNTKANIPSTCNSTTCGLKLLFSKKKSSLNEKLFNAQKEHVSIENSLQKLIKEEKELKEELVPYQQAKLLEQYEKLLRLLNYSYFVIDDWDKNLLTRVREQPMLIHRDLELFLQSSKSTYEFKELEQKKQKLQTELSLLIKSDKVSLEFLKNKLKEKEKEIIDYINNLSKKENQLREVNKEINLFEEYNQVNILMSKLMIRLEKGERALLVHETINFWKSKIKEMEQRKSDINVKLRELESIVKEQELVHHSYNTEVVNFISNIEKDKKQYECITESLSPNSGIPHKYVVKYINALITNVNKFISQIWTYRLYVEEIDITQPIDYDLIAEVGHSGLSSINSLSEGQTEIMNLSWVLTILLQMGKLKEFPLLLDEAGRALDPIHRMRLLDFFNQLINNHYIEQMFLVSHYEEFAHGFTDCDIIHITTTDAEIEPQANEHVKIVRY